MTMMRTAAQRALASRRLIPRSSSVRTCGSIGGDGGVSVTTAGREGARCFFSTRGHDDDKNESIVSKEEHQLRQQQRLPPPSLKFFKPAGRSSVVFDALRGDATPQQTASTVVGTAAATPSGTTTEEERSATSTAPPQSNSSDNNCSNGSEGSTSSPSPSSFTAVHVHPLSQVVLQYLQSERHDWIARQQLDRNLQVRTDGSFQLTYPDGTSRIWTYYDTMGKRHWLLFESGDVSQQFLLRDDLASAWTTKETNDNNTGASSGISSASSSSTTAEAAADDDDAVVREAVQDLIRTINELDLHEIRILKNNGRKKKL